MRGVFAPTDDRKNEPGLLNAREQDDHAMSAGELIAWYLANGYDIKAIRAIFPGFFHDVSAPDATWGTPELAWGAPPDELDETQRLLVRQRLNEDAWWQQHENDYFHPDQPNHLFPHL
jgi:hypothetical protein